MNIRTITDIQQLAVAGCTDWSKHGDVKVTQSGELLLFNYQRPVEWNYFERVCRGLIINKRTGEVVALPFSKIFNWGENGRKGTGHIKTVTEKIDGSLGILYRNGGFKIATRGSFYGSQAQWATEFFNKHWPDIEIPDEWTLIFEIIYPENRIVIDYGDKQDLVLLAIRNRFTGEYVEFFPDVYKFAYKNNFSTPPIYNFNNITEIIEAAGRLPGNQEGWVIEMSDGSRWKIKGDEYLELHRLISGLSPKRVLEAIREGSYLSLWDRCPEEFRPQVEAWHDKIHREAFATVNNIIVAYQQAPLTTRKEFALWVKVNYPQFAPYLFGIWDGKDLYQMILDRYEYGE